MIYKDDPATIQGFLEDTSNLRTGSTPGVFFPENIEELSALLRKPDGPLRFTIAGNGTGTTGGRIPHGDHVIAMERLTAIGEIEELGEERACIRVQAGALLGDIQKKVQESGWFYPPDPTEKLCFIGSTIANNSSGARTFKYGPTRAWIRSLRVVLSNGELLEIRRGQHRCGPDDCFRFEPPVAGHDELQRPIYRMPATSKHNAGYFSREGMELIDLFIGSEGTLGVIVEAELLLIRQPEAIISCLAYFRSLEGLLRFVELERNAPKEERPRALEFFERHALDFLRERYPELPEEAAGALFLELESSPETEESLLEVLLERIESCEGMEEESWLALDRQEQEAMREFRHALPLQVNEWLSRQQESKVSTDMAVPEESLGELLEMYRSTCEQHGFAYIVFGHIGNAHLHLNILPRNHEEFLEAKRLYVGFVERVVAMGGTLSAEHGIGKLKSQYLAAMYGQEGIAEMARIKRAFDPRLRLNIGNIIEESSLEPEKS